MPKKHNRDNQVDPIAQHSAYAKWLVEKTKDKACLIGIQGEGINTAFITEVVAELPPFITVKVSSLNIPKEGMWYDARQITFYKICDEAETLEVVAAHMKEHPELYTVVDSKPSIQLAVLPQKD